VLYNHHISPYPLPDPANEQGSGSVLPEPEGFGWEAGGLVRQVELAGLRAVSGKAHSSGPSHRVTPQGGASAVDDDHAPLSLNAHRARGWKPE
jgi:hypothetical protein